MDVGTWKIGVVATFLLGSAVAVAGETESWHYYYFKEKRPLELDPSRIAVLWDASDAATTEGAALSVNGLEVASAKRLAIPGWSLVAFQEEGTTASVVRRSVERIANQRATDFVSPVFVGEDGGPLIVTPVILVRFLSETPAERANAILRDSQVGTIIERDWANMEGAYRLRSSARDGFEVLAAANRLAVLPEVKFAEPDMIFTGRGALTPNDPGFSDCWGLHNTGQFGGIPDMDMDAPEAWDTTTGDSSIVVVIIDTGVQQDHPDIHQLTPGVDTTTDGGDGGPVNACDNHGTPVAGCVSATINNSLGTVGVAPGCRSASARTFISTLDCSGDWTASASWTVDSLAWAESIGARVTNNSNQYGFTSSAIEDKYTDTRDAGIVHFASAGNFSSSTITYPSSLSTVNAVAALDPDGTLTSFSNSGAGLAFSAPGIDVYTTDRTGSDGWVGGDYVFAAGTSFASPYTAGVAALVLSQDPSLTAAQVEGILQQTSVDLGSGGYDTTFGWGFVNADLALDGSPPACLIASQPQLMTLDKPSGATEVVTNRFLPVRVGDPGRAQLIQVTALSLPDPFSSWNGQVWWAGAPHKVCEKASQTGGSGCQAVPGQPKGRFYNWYAPLVCDPVSAVAIDWHGECAAEGTCASGLEAGAPCVTDTDCQVPVNLYNEGVLPSVRNQVASYEVRAVDVFCDRTDVNNFSAALMVTQKKLGNVAGLDITQCQPAAPDDAVGLPDVNALLQKFANVNCQIKKSRADLRGAISGPVDFSVSLPDINAALTGFANPIALPWGPVNPGDPCHLGAAIRGDESSVLRVSPFRAGAP